MEERWSEFACHRQLILEYHCILQGSHFGGFVGYSAETSIYAPNAVKIFAYHQGI